MIDRHRLRFFAIAWVAFTLACGTDVPQDVDAAAAAPDASVALDVGFDAGVSAPDAGEEIRDAAESPDASDSGPDPRFEALTTMLQTDLGTSGVPGAAIAVILDGRLVGIASVGLRDRGAGLEVTDDTLFQIASLSKTFTGALATVLHEEGTIDLDAPIRTYVPSFHALPEDSIDQITTHRLLTHSSGYPIHFFDFSIFNGADASADDALDQLFGRAGNVALWYPPGTLHTYSNIGYALLGLVLQRAAGTPFPRLLAERVLEPAGMMTATVEESEARARTHALGYSMGLASYDPTDFVDRTYDPYGGLFVSIRDLVAFAEVLLGSSQSALPSNLLSLMTARTMSSPNSGWGSEYGYGIAINRQGISSPVYSHTGGQTGFSSTMIIVPEYGFAFVGIQNADFGDGIFMAQRRALQAFVPGLHQVAFPEAQPRPSADWSRYVGVYEVVEPSIAQVEVVLGPSGLEVVFEDGGRTSLMPVQRDGFVGSAPPLDIEPGDFRVLYQFFDGADGEPEYLSFRVGVGHRTAD